jgi:hypothetical protein
MIPDVDDLQSSPMVHRYGDLFNPPGLTNFLGCVQVDLDLVGIRSLNFPPFACSDTVTASLFLDGRYFQSLGAPLEFKWFPDRIERSAAVGALHIHTTTVLAWKQMAAVVRIRIENRTGARRQVRLQLGLQANITRSVTPWVNAHPPCETDNVVEIDRDRVAVHFRSRDGTAHCLQGLSPRAENADGGGLHASIWLDPGESKTLSYINAVGASVADARALYDSLFERAPDEIQRVHDEWNAELRAVFTPGNDRYSGFLPTLHTSDKDIQKLYHMGILGVIYFKRDTPFSVHGRTYGTLLPRYWQTATFLWDYSLSSLVHALLDPAVMRKNLQLWMHTDIHKHFGTEFLTGAGIGPWYSVNDYAMTSIARDYLRWTGEMSFLDEPAGSATGATGGDPRRGVDYLEEYAVNWRRFQTCSGLADYGGLNNLLECVSTYLHEVASLNAANVFSMRASADLLELRNRSADAQQLRADARALASEVNKLYIPGAGYFNARFPDGSLRPVRHCYDFLTVLNTMSDDLSAAQKSEMVDFFCRELKTPTWMHALSAGDDNAMFSVRPDHQWTGAYPAWPPLCVSGLYRIGQTELAFNWLKGLAKSANQGPFGQAHFVEAVVAPEDGGARKAPPDLPWITDWTCSSNGAWVNCIIESIFGVNAQLNGQITALPQFGTFDPEASLENLSFQGKRYRATKRGIEAID